MGAALTQLPNLAQDGVAVSLIIGISTPVQVGLLMLMARQTGASAADYLGFKWPKRGEVVIGILTMIAFIIVGNLVSWLLGQNIVTPFQSDIYRTAQAAGWLPVLWLAVAVVTPIGEETLFRGFLFRGWHKSAARRLAGDRGDRAALGVEPPAIRSLRHRPDIRGRADPRLVPLGDRLDAIDHPAARPGQLRRHVRDVSRLPPLSFITTRRYARRPGAR